MADPKPAGTFRLFGFRGISVFLHWSWFLVALLELQWRKDAYGSPLWNLLEYLALFGLVLLHEFGHALACRSVGGRAERILLWPLGGIAYVQPPQRPGALLWSLAAGPLVNLALVPVTLGAVFLLGGGGGEDGTDLQRMMVSVAAINLVLLIFNLLPIYPLDGGQIVRSLLWYVVGRDRSLTLAAGFGLVASVLGGLAAFVFLQSFWIALIAGYAAFKSWQALQASRAMAAFTAGPRHPVYRCPACGEAPPAQLAATCGRGHGFDIFESDGHCPQCDATVREMPCLFCGAQASFDAFRPAGFARPYDPAAE